MVAIGRIVEVQGGGGSRRVRSIGRKDRHSKVFTSRGPRDRRVRLSALTAIQFYDVQDRLGFDRPSEAVDWLIQKAKASIEALKPEPLKGLIDQKSNDGHVCNNASVRDQAEAVTVTGNATDQLISSMTLEELVKAEDGNGQDRVRYPRHSDYSTNNMVSAFSSTETTSTENAIGRLQNTSYASFHQLQLQGYHIGQHHDQGNMSHSDEDINFMRLSNRQLENKDNSAPNCWTDEGVLHHRWEFQKTVLMNQKFTSTRDSTESRDLSPHHEAATSPIWEVNDQYNQLKPAYIHAQFRASDHDRFDFVLS